MRLTSQFDAVSTSGQKQIKAKSIKGQNVTPWIMSLNIEAAFSLLL